MILFSCPHVLRTDGVFTELKSLPKIQGIDFQATISNETVLKEHCLLSYIVFFGALPSAVEETLSHHMPLISIADLIFSKRPHSHCDTFFGGPTLNWLWVKTLYP